jgi:ParB-like chromosome segregation protein Spo0J
MNEDTPSILMSSISNEVISKNVSEISLHELANEHPKMTEVEFQRLKESIQELGQLEPVIMYKNQIVDGRHRYWAMESLDQSHILANEIAHNTPLDTVKEIVFGSEVRRHQSSTQKAIKAYWATQKDGITYREAEAKFMTSRTMIAACSYIDKVRGDDILRDLYKSIPVSIGKRTTTSLRTVQTLLKEEEAAAKDARLSEETHISIDKAWEEAKLFLDSLSREPTAVVERVASGAYAILKERE